MQIPKEQVKYRKKIGKLRGTPVWEVGLAGGLHLIIAAKNAKAETLGVGPHRAVARHIALQREPEMEITELSKGEYVEAEFFDHLLPRYQDMTERMRRLRD